MSHAAKLTFFSMTRQFRSGSFFTSASQLVRETCALSKQRFSKTGFNERKMFVERSGKAVVSPPFTI